MASLSQLIKRDHAYLVVVGLSIVFAYFTRKIRDVQFKKIFTASVGFAFALVSCETEVLHSLITILIGTTIIKCSHQGLMPRIVFVFTFMYRIFFCILSHLEMWRDENNLANGIQLVLTIKMISVAYEIADYRKHHLKHTNGHANGVSNGVGHSILKINNHKTLSLNEEPTFLDIFCYMYCFLGIGTGPFFRYRTYHDMIHMPPNVANTIPVRDMIMIRLPILAVLMLVSHFGGKYFSTDEMRSLEFYDNASLLYRFFYVAPIGAIGMARYGVVWYLSEFGLTMAGLGVYPESKQPEPGRGPTVFTENDIIWPVKESPKPVKYNIEAIRNVYINRGFAAETYAKTFRWWNCTVQWWLAHFIYASKIFSGQPSFIKWLAVATVSAVWHGFKAGYYFSFLGMVYVSFSEHFLLTEIGEKLTGKFQTLFKIIHYISFKVIGIGSFMTTFALSNYDDILKYLSSVYYGIYGIATLSIIISLVAKGILSPKPKTALKTD